MEDRILAWLVSLATAAPSMFASHSRDVYECARRELSDPGGPLERMKGLLNVIMDRVGKRVTRALEALAEKASDGNDYSVDETVDQILKGSTEELAHFNRVQVLREGRKTVTQRVRDRARFLQYYQLTGLAMALATLGLWYWLATIKVFAVPAAYVLAWIALHIRLGSTRSAEDRICDDYGKIEALYLDAP